MMPRFAIVYDGTPAYVANVIEWIEDLDLLMAPPGFKIVPDPGRNAGPGFTHDGGVFVSPPALVQPGSEPTS